MKPVGDIKIFAGSTAKDFALRMCAFMGAELGDSEVIQFSDGNTFVKIQETVRDNDVYLVLPIGMDPNNEFVELLFWMDAFKRASAASVTAIIPYYGYAKGDKKDEPRVSIRGRVCAECIELAGADRVVFMDLHAPQVQGFFKIPSDHLLCMPLLCEHVKAMGLVDNLVVVSPDAGFAKNARLFADYLGVNVAIGDKTRTAHDEKAKILEVIGDVEGKNCLIVDDFTISGGTLIEIAEALEAKGAAHIYVALSHILIRESGIAKLENSPIELIISTDSVKNPYAAKSDKVKIVSVAPLFAEAVMRINNRESVSPLFTRVPTRVMEHMDDGIQLEFVED
ncbi:ribose-phosphate pyrophosphokinase [Eubacteriales bacterium OttesenSCG-928-N14]|nr:ribose-phosphate pyrophosphokinase [Eubacteriales bacterium OttesenSCG-928-N14]